MVIIETVDDLKEKVKEITLPMYEVWKKNNPAEGEIKSLFGDKAAYVETIRRVWQKAPLGGEAYKTALREFFEATLEHVVGEKVSLGEVEGEGDSERRYQKKLLMVVPHTANPNGHSYDLNKPCLRYMSNSDGALRMAGGKGNSLTRNIAYLRPASEEEIEEFFKTAEYTFDEYESYIRL